MRRIIGAVLGLALVSGCAPGPATAAKNELLQVVTTTALLQDIAQNVGGDRVQVTSIVPRGADPTTFEPTLRSARTVATADVAFANYALYEPHHISKIIDANLPPLAAKVSLGEESLKYSAEVIPRVVATELDALWLGLGVRGTAARMGADRLSKVQITATNMRGPGTLTAYITGTFGKVKPLFSSHDGFNAADGFRDDTATLPLAAHSHVSWAFTKPGVYRLDLVGYLRTTETATPIKGQPTTVTFAVGVDPSQAGQPHAQVIDAGHADITFNANTGQFRVYADTAAAPTPGAPTSAPSPAAQPGSHAGHSHGSAPQGINPKAVIFAVPAKTLTDVPESTDFAFLNATTKTVYQLPQAVLGKNVHGEIDPHLWHSVRNVMAYAQLMRDTFIAQDPTNALHYRERTTAYLRELEATDKYVAATVRQVPPERRYLVTAHDTHAYFARAYGVKIAGFVTANPGAEPSLSQRRRLAETVRTLKIPAVFLEPHLQQRSGVLQQLADDHGLRTCALHGEILTDATPSYIDLMRTNAATLSSCLGAPKGTS